MSLAVQIRQPGGPEELQIVDVPVGEPGPGQIRIRHHAIGLNFEARRDICTLKDDIFGFGSCFA